MCCLIRVAKAVICLWCFDFLHFVIDCLVANVTLQLLLTVLPSTYMSYRLRARIEKAVGTEGARALTKLLVRLPNLEELRLGAQIIISTHT